MRMGLRAHAKRILFDENAVLSSGRVEVLALESRAAAKLGALYAPIGMQFTRFDDEVRRIVLHEVPRVPGELVTHAIDEVLRTMESHTGIAAEAHAQQMIEAGEVIHMRVTDEHIADPQQHAGRQARDVTDIEKQRTAREL